MKIKNALIMMVCLSVWQLSAQVGIGTTSPTSALEVEVTTASDGIRINNTAANGDPVMQYQLNGTSVLSMGIDDSDADKFKIGTTALTTDTRITLQTDGNIGIRTTTPNNLLHMTNGGLNIGATSMANFENSGTSGVSLSARNTSTTSGYNTFEGITDYSGSTYIVAGVFGLGIYQGTNQSINIGVRGHSNEWQGTGIRGSRFNSGGPNTGWGGEIYEDLGYTGFFGTVSDRKTKKNIQSFNGAIDIIKQLHPVTYYYDLDKYPNLGLNREMEYGFISQEVREIIPELTRVKHFDTKAGSLVKPNLPTENGYELFLTLDYTRLIPILTQSIKEQQHIIEEQESKISMLETKLAELESKIDGIIADRD